jgi:cytochrome c556
MKSLYAVVGGLAFVNGHAAEPRSAPDLHALMKTVVAPQTQVIWDVGNAAADDSGNPSAAKMKPEDWTKIAAAAGKVKRATQALTQATHVIAAAPGQKIQDQENPGASNAMQVQTAIDAAPTVFKAFAQQLTLSMDEVLTSTQKKDVAKLGDVSGRLDELCEQCHQRFWYPNEKKQK